MDKRTKATIFSGMVLIVSAAAQAEPAGKAPGQIPASSGSGSVGVENPPAMDAFGNLVDPLGFTTFSIRSRYPREFQEGPGGGAGDVESGDADADDGE